MTYMHIEPKTIRSWTGTAELHRQPTEPISEQGELPPLIHCKHGQTHEMKPASGNQGYLMKILIMLQS